MTLYKGTTPIAGIGKFQTNAGWNIFDCKWSDHILNDIQWLRADSFSWQSGLVYVSAYNHLVSDISGITAETETVGGYTVTFYRASDGHKVVLADQETTVNNIFSSTGIAWYYILDTANTQFKLPRTKWNFEGVRDNVGDYVAESLPNITGNIPAVAAYTSDNLTLMSGVFSNTWTETTMARGSNAYRGDVNFNASNSSSTYQNNAPVQERATQMYLYFYVGEYTQTAIEQTAGITTEQLNNKIDTDHSNDTKPYLKTTYVSGTSGYNIWSNGYCEQWGVQTSNSVTFIKTFTDSEYTIYRQLCDCTITNTSTVNVAFVGALDNITKSTTGFTATVYTGLSFNKYTWKACGYLAEGEY